MKKRIWLGCLMAFCLLSISAVACLLEASCFDIIYHCRHFQFYSTPLEYLLILPSLGIALSLLLMFGAGTFIAWRIRNWARASWRKESVLGFLLASMAMGALGLYSLGAHIYRSASFFAGELVSSFALDSEHGYANAFALDVVSSSLALPSSIFFLRLFFKDMKGLTMEKPLLALGRGAFAFLFAFSFFALPLFYAFGFAGYMSGATTIYGFNSHLVFACSNLCLIPFLCFAGAKIWMERASTKKKQG